MACERGHTHFIVFTHACGYYSRAATISLVDLQVRLLFEGGYYSGCGFYSNKYGIYHVHVDDDSLVLSLTERNSCYPPIASYYYGSYLYFVELLIIIVLLYIAIVKYKRLTKISSSYFFSKRTMLLSSQRKVTGFATSPRHSTSAAAYQRRRATSARDGSTRRER